ncbi:cytochrome-c peroxidase [Pseudorhodoplanes sp.]|uniref:cytochrome-c peroxidase n=1 Tax=Pseudorhodoplanes sp. TaxID=1934341 RepID=UPI002BE046FD|nr:cytochrome c peroxidase [Pseudorhodoplanes sp.]HWV54531.1 cytochrome c peroxidase [Pseudorhodoplanes sp.]
MHRPLAFLVTVLLIASGAAALASDVPRPDDLRAMKAEYRRSAPRIADNPALVALGRTLFFDPVISASGKTACASCHRPELAWADDVARSMGDSGRLTERRVQTLLGIGHARPPFDWDGRHATLEAQAVSSIGTGSMSMFATPHEMRVDDIVARLRRSDSYAAAFARAMPGQPINLDNVVIALAAFERTIEPGDAPFDRWIAGDETAIPDAAKRGFVVFNKQGNCVGCHRGWRFTDDQFHDIGISNKDPGRGRERKDDPFAQFAFKTPTLRSVALRPPYMHDGSLKTLRDVVDHYVKGGIDRPSRSPMMRPVDLTEDERKDLVAFLRTLTGE